jgi:hypothetical protein
VSRLPPSVGKLSARILRQSSSKYKTWKRLWKAESIALTVVTRKRVLKIPAIQALKPRERTAMGEDSDERGFGAFVETEPENDGYGYDGEEDVVKDIGY